MTADPRHRFGALAYRDLRLYLATNLLGNVEFGMSSVAIGWEVYDVTRQPVALGYLGLAGFIPAAGLSLFGGLIADRFDRRKILVIGQLANIALSLLLMVHARSAGATVWPIYVVSFLRGVTSAFILPARQALTPNLVPPEYFMSAISWLTAGGKIASIVGPALGGLVYGTCNAAAPVFLLCAALQACSLLALVAMRWRSERVGRPEVGVIDTLFAGFRYVWQRRILFGAMSLDLFAMLLGGATALLPVYARDVLKVGPSGLGAMQSAPSLGAAVVVLVLARRSLPKSGVVMLAGVALFGLATVVFGVSRSFGLSITALAVAGGADVVSFVVRRTLIQLNTPDPMRGRVAAVNLVFVGASNELGSLESGLTAAWLGTVTAVVVGGVGACAVVVLWAVLFPELRRVDRLDGPARARE
jgi:MFS family permease